MNREDILHKIGTQFAEPVLVKVMRTDPHARIYSPEYSLEPCDEQLIYGTTAEVMRFRSEPDVMLYPDHSEYDDAVKAHLNFIFYQFKFTNWKFRDIGTVPDFSGLHEFESLRDIISGTYNSFGAFKRVLTEAGLEAIANGIFMHQPTKQENHYSGSIVTKKSRGLFARYTLI